MQDAPELAALTRRVYAAMTNGDAETLAHVVSRHEAALLVGTDPQEWWRGHDTIVSIFTKQLDELLADAGSFRWDTGELLAYCDGNLGWVADNPTVTMGTGEVVKMRSSMVYRLEHAQWKIVHWHVSVGVPNEEAVGRELTTTFDALVEDVGQTRPNMESAAAPDGTVTLLFSDVENSTALLGELGDQRYMELLQWHHGVVRNAVAQCEGHEVSYQGDGFMLAFASARRALRCALDIQDGIAAGRPPDLPGFNVRMGLHTGEALRHRDDFYGHVVHYAARVAGSAMGGEVLVSSVVRQLLMGDNQWQFRATAPREFKGFEGEQIVFAALRA
jgi:class 3 adenylate cyclase